MSMLAEPRRKKKWSLNPRGKLWSNDDSKLGQKLLEKMGWSKGKGLGREEQGDLEPVRLKYKNDAEGVGYIAKDDQWIAHHEEFNAILGKLSGIDEPAPVPETVPVKSLEVRSKVSKARVHYHKFTRGKDLSRYSSTDLASILGKRVNSSSTIPAEDATATIHFKEEDVKKEEAVEESSESSSDTEHSHGVTTINKGNIHEYFAAKMAALKEKSKQTSPVVNQPEQSAEEQTEGKPVPELNPDNGNGEKRVRINEELNQIKEFCSKKKITEWSQETLAKATSESSDSETEKKVEKIKKKKKKKDKSGDAGEAVILETTAENASKHEVLEPPKSKKRKLEPEVDASTAQDSSVTDETPKKKKKKKSKDNDENCPPVQINDDQPDGALIEEGSKKKKKKNKAECTDIHPIDNTANEQDDLSLVVKNKKKKKKEKSDDDAEMAAPSLQTQQIEVADQQSETDEPPKKKKKKNKNQVAGTAEVANQPIPIEPEADEPKKKKKKKKTTTTANADEDSTLDSNQHEAATKNQKQSNPVDATTDLPGTVSAARQVQERGPAPNPNGVENNYPEPNFSYLDRQSKIKESQAKYQMASFEMFRGSNLFALAGYGNSS